MALTVTYPAVKLYVATVTYGTALTILGFIIGRMTA